MPILLLIRHATNDFVKTGRLPGHSPNIHLNEEGIAQAVALTQALSKRKLHAVYASHLERAIETAFRVAAPHGLPVSIRPAMADIDNGDFTGKSIKDISEGEATKDLWKVVVEKPSDGPDSPTARACWICRPVWSVRWRRLPLHILIYRLKTRTSLSQRSL